MTSRKEYHPLSAEVPLPKKISHVKCMISEMYYIPCKIAEIDSKLQDIIDDMASVRGVSYEGIPSDGNTSVSRDEKLASMVTRTIDLEQQKEALKTRYNAIRSQLHIKDLSELDMQIVDAVHTTASYFDAGQKIGYSKTQIFRKIKEIYRRLAIYV